MKKSPAVTKSLIISAFAATCLFNSGCASTSAVVPMGPDTYMISKGNAMSLGSGGALKADLYQKADAWCREKGLVMVPVSERSVDGLAYSHGTSAEVVFRALRPGDPEIKRTSLRKQADTVIEVR
jgi:hypothetical protein